jgi:pimeloyl-ACP methyl ester carboxylesterase
MHPGEFRDHGFVAAVHDRGWPVDILIVHPDLDSYLDGRVAEWLRTDIARVVPRRSGYGSTWLLGVSLGALGASLCSLEAPALVDGIMFLAPYLGSPGVIAEIQRAGGLEAWRPGIVAAEDIERRALAWLKRHSVSPSGPPRLLLAYGHDDRFADAHRMLSRLLPPESVVTVDGGHDWQTWTRLWPRLLDLEPFTVTPGG